MSNLPSALLQSLQGLPGFDLVAFERAHTHPEKLVSIRFNPAKANLPPVEERSHRIVLPEDRFTAADAAANAVSIAATPVPWSSYGFYLAERPSFIFDPLFHSGVYYVQEASSMFLEQALKQTVDLSKPVRILDLCAAPGGKSTLLQSLINEQSLLVSNEVIKSRAATLEENMTKWGASNVVVTNNDPAHFARLPNYFDVMVVDAPCSGSGLFRRDSHAIQEWSENNVQLCSQRQQRILADAWPALKPGGILIYATCSYSREEDESILDWLVADLGAESLALDTAPEWQIVATQSDKRQALGYRFYPDKVKGEGFFIAALQKATEQSISGPAAAKNKLEQPTKAEEALARPWLADNLPSDLLKQSGEIIALPAFFTNDLILLQSCLYIKKAGVKMGKTAGNDFIPDPVFALSTVVNAQVGQTNLSRQQAIQYLRKENFALPSGNKGWLLVGFEGHSLGWIKQLATRFNNYYPKEWRILKHSI